MKRTTLTIAIALLLTAPLAAQKKGASGGPSPIDVTLDQIHDRRTTSSFSHLELAIELKGIAEADVVASRTTILEAVDDTGRSLVDPEAGEPQFQSTSGAYFKEQDKSKPATVTFKLVNPTREAVSLTRVRGEVEVYMPGKDKDATVVIPKFQSSPGKPYVNKSLKANGIEVTLMGAAQFEAEKKKASKARAAELKAEGQDDETIKWMIESFESSFFVPSEGEIALKVKDPNKRIHEYAYLDGAGEVQRVSGYERDGFIVLSTWGAPPDASWGLRLSLRTPKTMARHGFTLQNVALP